METPTLFVNVPARTRKPDGQIPDYPFEGDDANHRLASKIADALPGEVHFVVTPVPFAEDETMQEVVSIMQERMDHVICVPCAGMSHMEVLDQIDYAGHQLTAYEGRRMRMAVVCTDLPWDFGEYRSSLYESIDDLRAIGATMVASIAPEGEPMLAGIGKHERHYPLDYRGPVKLSPEVLERRMAARREPVEVLLSLCLPALMTVEEAARIIRVSPERLRRLIRRGEIEGAVYVGNKLRINTNALLTQFGISAREALPSLVNTLECLYEIFVEGAGTRGGWDGDTRDDDK